MTERALASRHAVDIDRTDSPHALLWFLTITHPNLNPPVRVVADWFDYEIDGHLYQRAPFRLQPLTDNDQAASAELVVQNIDRRIGEALENDIADERAIISARAYSSADFDLSVEPRVPLDPNDLPTLYGFDFLELADVQGDVLELVGRVTRVDIAQEEWPYFRATQDRFPGLFA